MHTLRHTRTHTHHTQTTPHLYYVEMNFNVLPTHRRRHRRRRCRRH